MFVSAGDRWSPLQCWNIVWIVAVGLRQLFIPGGASPSPTVLKYNSAQIRCLDIIRYKLKSAENRQRRFSSLPLHFSFFTIHYSLTVWKPLPKHQFTKKKVGELPKRNPPKLYSLKLNLIISLQGGREKRSKRKTALPPTRSK